MGRKHTHTHTGESTGTVGQVRFNSRSTFLVLYLFNGGLGSNMVVILCFNCTMMGTNTMYTVDILYVLLVSVLSTCSLHTNSGCGKERRILTGPVPGDSRQ